MIAAVGVVAGTTSAVMGGAAHAAATVGHAAAGPLIAAWLEVPPGSYDPSSGHGPDWGKAAPAGLLIWMFMGVCLFFLIKSMNKHMRRVPESFDTDPRADADANSGPDTDPTAGAHDSEPPGDAAADDAAPSGTGPGRADAAR